MGLLLKRETCHSLTQTPHSFNVFIPNPERDKTQLTGLLAFCLTVPRTNVGYLHVWMLPDKRVHHSVPLLGSMSLDALGLSYLHTAP